MVWHRPGERKELVEVGTTLVFDPAALEIVAGYVETCENGFSGRHRPGLKEPSAPRANSIELPFCNFGDEVCLCGTRLELKAWFHLARKRKFHGTGNLSHAGAV